MILKSAINEILIRDYWNSYALTSKNNSNLDFTTLQIYHYKQLQKKPLENTNGFNLFHLFSKAYYYYSQMV